VLAQVVVPFLLSTLSYEDASALGWWWYLKQLRWRGRMWPTVLLQPQQLRGWAALVKELLETTAKRTDPVR
jgi:hypothetical protein